jgi:hypothetical protein
MYLSPFPLLAKYVTAAKDAIPYASSPNWSSNGLPSQFWSLDNNIGRPFKNPTYQGLRYRGPQIVGIFDRPSIAWDAHHPGEPPSTFGGSPLLASLYMNRGTNSVQVISQTKWFVTYVVRGGAPIFKLRWSVQMLWSNDNTQFGAFNYNVRFVGGEPVDAFSDGHLQKLQQHGFDDLAQGWDKYINY